jgi:hypothetical protein
MSRETGEAKHTGFAHAALRQRPMNHEIHRQKKSRFADDEKKKVRSARKLSPNIDNAQLQFRTTQHRQGRKEVPKEATDREPP